MMRYLWFIWLRLNLPCPLAYVSCQCGFDMISKSNHTPNTSFPYLSPQYSVVVAVTMRQSPPSSQDTNKPRVKSLWRPIRRQQLSRKLFTRNTWSYIVLLSYRITSVIKCCHPVASHWKIAVVSLRCRQWRQCCHHDELFNFTVRSQHSTSSRSLNNEWEKKTLQWSFMNVIESKNHRKLV